ncbi:ABC transporter permease [Pseudoflavitalea rhizosphaerae]|uniref:ABC transporter permease n=1 Tax=Pseudoflavitalea rhizosphaerae TaxID=1884793 RepID=UPI0019CFE69C|nr:ABC transporter permease [Pseudoflavitalea rhizosphaerae]
MPLTADRNEPWDWENSNRSSWRNWAGKELWAYRNLLFRLIKRDFLVNYQQTLLGPLWVVLQPILTLIVYVLVFGRWMGVDTGASPPVLFYLCGILLWGLFSDLFTGTAFIFTHYSSLYTKVYFPRLIIPLSVTGTHLLRFLIQFLLLVAIFVFYAVFRDFSFPLNFWLLTLPLSILLTALFALALGLIFCVLTARYRDLGNIVHLGIRLSMFVTPVIYPLSLVPSGIRWFAQVNPLSALFEVFRYALLGQGEFTMWQLLYSTIFIIITFFIALIWFNKQAIRLIDIA